MSDLHYWYQNQTGANLISDLPPQAILSKDKTPAWEKGCMNALERIGIKQFNENKRFVDYYRMTSGKVSYTELSELIPQFRELEGLLDDFKIPNTIKHFDILGIILNYLETVMVENKDKFYPTNIDEISSNERQREQLKLVKDYVKEKIDKEIAIGLAQQGLDENRTAFKSEEEKQAYIQQIQQTKQALTPPEIKKYLETDFKTVAIDWCTHMLKADEQRFRLNEIFRKNVKDYLHTGKCFKHYFLKYDSYAVEDWSPINTFFSQTIDSKYPQYGEYVGRIHFYTPSDFINKKGQFFSEKQKAKLLNSYSSEAYKNSDDSSFSFEMARDNNFQETKLAPHANYFDYNFLVDLQDQIGVPLANRTIRKKDGTTETIQDYLPRRNGNRASNVNQYAKFLREDLNLRTDMIMVTEAYWRSYKKVGYITYLNEDGIVTSDMVTDEIMPEFLEENEIKTLKNVTLEDLRKNPRQPNTIIWDYIPEIWVGEKAKTDLTALGEDSYYNIHPLEYQIKGDSNMFDVSIPVAGIISENPSDKIMPYQNLHNIAMNQQVSMQEKELGFFFLFDVNFLPSDIREYGDTETTLLNMMQSIRGTGLLGLDGTAKNMQNAGGGNSSFNQFQMVGASLGAAIKEKMEQADYYRMKAFEQFGLNSSVLGQPVKYLTATGVDQTNTATQSQTDYLYDDISNFESRALEIHINIAQFAQGDGRDISVEYTKDDLSQAFLKFSDKFMPLRKFGIKAVSDSKKRKELELMKQYLLNQNTMDMDELTLSSLISSDSMQSIMAIAKLERIRKEQQLQDSREHEKEILDKQIESTEKNTYLAWQLDEISKGRDRQKDLLSKKLDAESRVADNNGSLEMMQFISDDADRVIELEKINKDSEYKNRLLDSQIESLKNTYKQQQQSNDLKKEELKLKNKKIEADKFTSIINKN